MKKALKKSTVIITLIAICICLTVSVFAYSALEQHIYFGISSSNTSWSNKNDYAWDLTEEGIYNFILYRTNDQGTADVRFMQWTIFNDYERKSWTRSYQINSLIDYQVLPVDDYYCTLELNTGVTMTGYVKLLNN